MATDTFWATALGHMSELFNAAMALTRERAAAEDLVQETYRVALERQEQLRDLGRCRAWLFRILRNLHLDSLRRGHRQAELTVIPGGSEEAATAAIDAIDSGFVTAAEPIDVRRALDRLGEEFRTAVILCDVEGFTYEEIAEIMECPIGTVRSRIARARARVAESLRGRSETGGLARKEKKP
jgi:RNA polymerase sigma-70 factor (ECF subfamily)